MNNRGSRIFLMEIIIAVMFFALVSAFCLRIFVQSHLYSQESEALNHAIAFSSSISDLLLASKNEDEFFETISTVYPDAEIDNVTTNKNIENTSANQNVQSNSADQNVQSRSANQNVQSNSADQNVENTSADSNQVTLYLTEEGKSCDQSQAAYVAIISRESLKNNLACWNIAILNANVYNSKLSDADNQDGTDSLPGSDLQNGNDSLSGPDLQDGNASLSGPDLQNGPIYSTDLEVYYED